MCQNFGCKCDHERRQRDRDITPSTASVLKCFHFRGCEFLGQSVTIAAECCRDGRTKARRVNDPSDIQTWKQSFPFVFEASDVTYIPTDASASVQRSGGSICSGISRKMECVLCPPTKNAYDTREKWTVEKQIVCPGYAELLQKGQSGRC